ncbi:hypothetical protein [Kitasatospora kifunensis]|uniref:Uncharacterized protein n=1 Tax=Kitasatospora kifunensis TaxID=58351 RepID=A0A7W7RCN0_KITKI|nr:hypothetical protein [Kitasatospora kifunensis]MBB4929153.1 hypothetical protein [Kitasatospora kifunensis]
MTDLRTIAVDAMTDTTDPGIRGVIAALVYLSDTVLDDTPQRTDERTEAEQLEDQALDVLAGLGTAGATDLEFAEALEKENLAVPRRQRQKWLGDWANFGLNAVRHTSPGGLHRFVHAAHAAVEQTAH